MKKVLIFGGLAIVGYFLYVNFIKKNSEVEVKKGQTQPKGCGAAGCGDMPNPNTPNTPSGIVLMGDIDSTKPNVIETAVVRKKNKFIPNKPIGRPNLSGMLKGNCQCIKAPCNC